MRDETPTTVGFALRRFSLLVALVLTACEPAKPRSDAKILLFVGAGTSVNDVTAVEKILKERRMDYTTADSRQINRMTAEELMSHRLLILPGGNFIKMGDGLAEAATTNIRTAVQGGLSYLGICAGGFLAGETSHYRSLGLASGVQFAFYAAEKQGIRKAAVPISFVDGPVHEHYWEDGPQFTGWGTVIGKYPDGTPAIVEGRSGKGRVILSGVHPEAPENWRHGMTFKTPAEVDNDYAGTLIEAALKGTLLPHY